MTQPGGVSTELRCNGCPKMVTTDAVRPEDWPDKWCLCDDGVFHNRECELTFASHEHAKSQMRANAEKVENGVAARMVGLARDTLRASNSKKGSGCDLANLVLKLFSLSGT